MGVTTAATIWLAHVPTLPVFSASPAFVFIRSSQALMALPSSRYRQLKNKVSGWQIMLELYVWQGGKLVYEHTSAGLKTP